MPSVRQTKADLPAENSSSHADFGRASDSAPDGDTTSDFGFFAGDTLNQEQDNPFAVPEEDLESLPNALPDALTESLAFARLEEDGFFLSGMGDEDGPKKDAPKDDEADADATDVDAPGVDVIDALEEGMAYAPEAQSPASLPFGFAMRARAAAENEHTTHPEQLWVILGDVHGDVSLAGRIPDIDKATGLIVTGDLTRMGGVAEARSVIEQLRELNPVVLAQIGNMDRPEVNDWLEEEGMNLHRKVRSLAPHVLLLGVGGSTFTPFGTPSEFPEARFAEWLEELVHRAGDYRVMVLVTHNPPFETVCDRTHAGTHVGSRALREFIEEKQPDICLCGHIHEGVGQQLIGRTRVVNPGTLAAGAYALLHVSASPRVTLHRLEA